MARPGGFVTARDYREKEVLAVSRPVPGLPWLLISKVDRAEALAGTEARLTRFLIIALLAIALGSALVFALWRHGASRRATEAAQRYADMARRFEARGELLRLVTDSQPNAIYITDAEGHVSYANDEAAREAGISGDDMVGKSLAALFGPAEARPRARAQPAGAGKRPKGDPDRIRRKRTGDPGDPRPAAARRRARASRPCWWWRTT